MDSIQFLNNLAETKAKYNLGAGVPPLELYPQLFPDELMTLFVKETGADLMPYHRTEGILGEFARTTILLNENIRVEENQVVLTNGVQEAIFLTLQLFKGNKVACLDPYYPGFVDAARIVGCELEVIKEENFLLGLNSLKKGDLFYISADNSNPSGKTLTQKERETLVEIASERGFFLFDDSTYREFNLEAKLPTLFSINPKCVIHALSFSKILAPGLRTAFLYLPEALRKSLLKLKSSVSLNNSGFTQGIVGGWLLKNEFILSNHLGIIKNRLRENQKVLVKFGVEYSGGFFILFKPKNQFYNMKLCNSLLLNQGISTCPLSLFSPHENGHLRLCIANINEQQLQKVLDIIINFDYHEY